MKTLFGFTAFLFLIASTAAAAPEKTRGAQFLGLKSFSSFKTSPGENASETVLTSHEFATLIKWDELVVSWDAETPPDGYLKVEARGISPAHITKYYTMGIWSADPSRHPRQSVSQQKDADGDVSTDTLKVEEPCDRVQIRLTLGGGERPKLKFLGLCVLDSKAMPAALPPN